MALEPTVPQLGEEATSELQDMTRRFWISLVPTLPMFILSMAGMLPGLELSPTVARAENWLGLLLSSPVVFWAGWPFFERAFQALRHGTSNMFTLISLGTIAAWSYSAVITLDPNFIPPGLHEQHGTIPTYFESAAVIVTLVLLGQVLELRQTKNGRCHTEPARPESQNGSTGERCGNGNGRAARRCPHRRSSARSTG